MTKISLYNRLAAKGKPHTCDEILTLTDFLNFVKYGKWKDQIQAIRAIADKTARDNAKKNIPSVTIAGVFKERKAELLIEHSGFIAVDIDGYNDKSALLADPYTYALFYSASGKGVVVVAKVNPDKHKESYRWLSNYYFTTYGIAVDEAPKSVASLRFVSFDPDLFINERSKKSGVKAEPKARPQSIPVVLPQSVAAEMCAECAAQGHDIAPDYDSYFRLGLSLAKGFGEDGRAMFHTLCGPSPKYDSVQADRKFTECMKTAPHSKVNVGTFYWMLKQVGIHAPTTNHRAVQVAALGKKAGRNVEGVVQQLVEMEGIGREQAQALANEVYQRDDIDIRKVSADPENIIEGVMEFIKQNHPIRRNSITQKLEENGQEVSKERLNTIYLRARSMFNTKDITYDLIDRVIFSDFTHEFNPIHEYIDRNRYRNASGHIAALTRTIKTDSPNSETFIRKWCLGWIAAIHGHPVRSVLTLVGGQNTGKTEWFRRLPPSALRKYYAESKLDAGKDDDILMCQKLWVMDDEMGGKSKQDEKRFKELTSKSTFSLRAPYGRHNEDYKRLAVLCGTSNEEDIINDPTGNTRILPVRVISIDHEAYNAIDKDELFMECVRAFESGEEWQLNKSELAALDEMGVEFETTPFERELILAHFSPPRAGAYSTFLSSTDIKDVIETRTKQKLMSNKRFGMELKRIFGKPVSKRINGFPVKVYEVVKLEFNHPTTHESRATTKDDDDIPF
jgi:uncharacterized protein YeeX (DUF496 family)